MKNKKCSKQITDIDNKAYAIFSLGEKYLNLSMSASKMIVKNNNRNLTITSFDISKQPHEFDDNEWSDFELGIPLIFNFYHGVELMMKGILSLHGEAVRNHKLTELFDKILKIPKKDKQIIHITKLLRSIIKDIKKKSPIGRFLKTNEITIDDWYQALKYPEISKNKQIWFFHLQHGEKGELPFWENIADLSLDIRVKCANYYGAKVKETT